MLGLRFCARAFSSCGEQGPLFITVHGSLIIMASLVAEHRLQMRRLSSCGSWAQLLCGMWDLPRPGLEPVSPALTGRFSTTVPPGKPLDLVLLSISSLILIFDPMSAIVCKRAIEAKVNHIYFPKEYTSSSVRQWIRELFQSSLWLNWAWDIDAYGRATTSSILLKVVSESIL